MMRTLAIENYRSLRLLADGARGGMIAALAREGGLPSTLWAGPEQTGTAVREGRHPVQGTVRTGPVALRSGRTPAGERPVTRR
jgi:predicted ATPase